MNGPSSAREALIAETLGEMAGLLERMEALAPALEASRLALIQASEKLSHEITAFESRMLGVCENVKLQAIRHVARRTDELSRATLDLQVKAMHEAARAAFSQEVSTELQRQLAVLHKLAEADTAGAGPRRAGVLTLAAASALAAALAATLASALTWVLATDLL